MTIAAVLLRAGQKEAKVETFVGFDSSRVLREVGAIRGVSQAMFGSSHIIEENQERKRVMKG